jgi:acyl-CoA reductase-like NAD-dependent aldehyde dehydrogenase
LVGGDWIEVRSDNAIAVDNPATGEVIGSVPDLGAIETKRAIAAAEVAQKEWAAHTAKERSAILRRWFELMMESRGPKWTCSTCNSLAYGRAIEEVAGFLCRSGTVEEVRQKAEELELLRSKSTVASLRALLRLSLRR